MSRKFLFTVVIISVLLTGCLGSEREFSNPYGFSLKYPSHWTVKETRKSDAYFMVFFDDRREDQAGLSFYFYPASADEIHYSCEALGEGEKLYVGELITCEIVDINGHKYIQADVARNYGGANQYISFILTTNIGDNFLKISSGYYKKDGGEREKIKKILQSLTINDRASQPLLSEKFIGQLGPKKKLVQYRVPKHPESPYENNHLVKLIDLVKKTSTLLPLEHFNGEFAYLLPTNEILYTSSPFTDGQGGAPGFRLYSLDTETDEFVAGAQSHGPFLVEKFNKNLRQVQLLEGYLDGENAERALLDLRAKKLMKAEKGSLGFFECIEDPDGTCGAAADKSLRKWKKFLAIGGLDQETLLQIAADASDNKMNQYTAPSCENYSDILREVEAPTAEIIGCIN